MSVIELMLKHAENVRALSQAIAIDTKNMTALTQADMMVVRKVLQVLAEGERRLLLHRHIIVTKIMEGPITQGTSTP